MRWLTLIASFLLAGNSFGKEDSILALGAQKILDPLVDEGYLPAYYFSVINKDGALLEKGRGSSGNLDHFDPDGQTKFALLDLSKPVVAVAALKLVSDGSLELDAPVSYYLPEFKHSSSQRLDYSAKEATVRDLFTHTAGFANNPDHSVGRRGILGDDSTSSRLSETYREKDVFTLRSLLSSDLQEVSLENQVNRLAKLPLLYEPRTSFEYSVATEVLGRVIEVVSGLTLDTALQKLLFEHLDMRDTGFSLTAEEQGDRAILMKPLIRTFPVPGNYQRYEPYPFPAEDILGIGERANYFSGGFGLVSTGDDMAKFVRFLLKTSMTDSESGYFSPDIAKLIFDNQLPQGIGGSPLAGKLPRANNDGFSLLLNIRTKQNRYEEKITREQADYYYWSGFSSSVIWIDNKEGVAGVFLSQMRPPQDYLVSKLVRMARESDVAK